MKQKSRILFWKRMSSQKITEHDLVRYKHEELSRLYQDLNEFLETFCREGILTQENLVKVSYDLIAWITFCSGISLLAIFGILRTSEENFGMMQALYLLLLSFAYGKTISRIIRYPENQTLYQFVKSDYYQHNRAILYNVISLFEQD